MITEIDGKKVIIKGNKRNVPPLKIIKNIYSKIPDDKKIPIVFETKAQYLGEYIKNQENIRGKPFPKSDVEKYKSTELGRMNNIVSRYTTRHNPYIDVRTVFFTDNKITPVQFAKSAFHEYGHEAWEKIPKLRKDWKSVSQSTAPTPYGRTARQEDMAESYMLYKTGALQDTRRKDILSKDLGAKGLQGPASYGMTYSANRIDPLKQFDINHDGVVDDKDILLMKKRGMIKKDGAPSMAINLKDTRKFKFGTVPWQEAVEHNINAKMAHNEVLGPMEKSYIDVQREIHPKEDIEITFKPFKEPKRDEYGEDSVGDALGWSIPDQILSGDSWKVYGAPKEYDPRLKERADLKGNIYKLMGEHYGKLTRLQAMPGGAPMPLIDISSYDDTVLEALGSAVETAKQRLSKENRERAYYGMDRPHTGKGQKVLLTSPIKAGLVWTGATAVKGAQALGKELLPRGPIQEASTAYGAAKAEFQKGAQAKAAEYAKYEPKEKMLPSQLKQGLSTAQMTEGGTIQLGIPPKSGFKTGKEFWGDVKSFVGRDVLGMPQKKETAPTPETTQVPTQYMYMPPPEKPPEEQIPVNYNVLSPTARLSGQITRSKPWILQ